MAESMKGRRIDCPFAPDGALIGEWPQPGDYYLMHDQGWFGCTPNGHLAGLAKHNVIEHDDGAITVAPSILVGGMSASDAGIRVGDPRAPALWHGYLERGVWREC